MIEHLKAVADEQSAYHESQGLSRQTTTALHVCNPSSSYRLYHLLGEIDNMQAGQAGASMAKSTA